MRIMAIIAGDLFRPGVRNPAPVAGMREMSGVPARSEKK